MMDLSNNPGNRALTAYLPPLNGKRRRNNDIPVVYGKVQPQAKELEEVILGAILLDKGAFDLVAEILKPECFYVDAHQIIFRAMQVLEAKSSPIDLLTVVEELRRREELDIVGGPYFVTKLTNNVVSAASIETHSRIVLEKFMAREIIRIGGEMIADAYEDSTDVFDLIESAESGIYEISASHLKNDFSVLSSGLPKMISRIEQLQTMDSSVTGVSSGFRELDLTTHGWQPTDLIIVAARPSVGKTCFALNLAKNATTAASPVPVGMFSLEMSIQQLLQRVVSMGSGLRMEKLSSGKLADYEMRQLLEHGGKMMEAAPIFVDDTAALSLFALRSRARRMVNKFKVGLIIVDYLQLMTTGKENRGNREQEISTISRGLKALAKDLKVPVIALSQLSRMIETRGKGQKVPVLSDLRESGAIEQDADMVIFLYKPGQDEIDEDAALAYKGLVKIAKHRNGPLNDFSFEVNNAIQKWDEIGVLNSQAFKPLTTQNTFGYRDPLTPKSEFIQIGSKMNNEFDTGFNED